MVYESQSETSEVEVEVIALPEGAFHVASFIKGIAYEARRDQSFRDPDGPREPRSHPPPASRSAPASVGPDQPLRQPVGAGFSKSGLLRNSLFLFVCQQVDNRILLAYFIYIMTQFMIKKLSIFACLFSFLVAFPTLAQSA